MTNHTLYIRCDHCDRKAQVLPGNTITDFRGEDWVFLEVSRGPEPGRSAKVVVRDEIGTREFYAEVFPGLEVI